jgi:hypothetical protein
MKRMVMVVVAAWSLGLAYAAAAAEDAPAKPDCSDKQKAVDEAKASAKTASAKPDLSPCKDMKGKEKTDCEKPIKDKSAEESKAAKDKVTSSKKDLACCKNPKGKGCTPS